MRVLDVSTLGQLQGRLRKSVRSCDDLDICRVGTMVVGDIKHGLSESIADPKFALQFDVSSAHTMPSFDCAYLIFSAFDLWQTSNACTHDQLSDVYCQTLT